MSKKYIINDDPIWISEPWGVMPMTDNNRRIDISDEINGIFKGNENLKPSWTHDHINHVLNTRKIILVAPGASEEDVKIFVTKNTAKLHVKLSSVDNEHMSSWFREFYKDYTFSVDGYEISSVDISNGLITIILDKVVKNELIVEYKNGYKRTNKKEQTESK